MEERRKFPRLKYPCKLKFSSAEDREGYVVHTENISGGGFRVILQKKLAVNSPVEIELMIGKKNIKAEGRIAWVLDIKSPGAEEANLFDTGVEFTQIPAEDKEFLSKLVEEFLKKV